MDVTKREHFERFGRIDTWIVGIQYYDGADGLEPGEVFFARQPDNPFDPDAVAVFTRSGRQIGHLPRYDAEHLSPLIADGAVVLAGRVGESDRSDRLPLALEVYVTAKISTLFQFDNRDDWRALYHNQFTLIWQRLDHYSSGVLEEFRGLARKLAHGQGLFPKTKFLYRLLKAHIVDLKRREQDQSRQRLLSAVAAMPLGSIAGWPGLSVIPVLAEDASAPPVVPNAPGDEAELRAVGRSALLGRLPERCPYPPGAHGAIVLVHGRRFSVDWFDAAACAQVYWYQWLLAGLERALQEEAVAGEELPRTPEEVRAELMAELRRAEFTRAQTQEEAGVSRTNIRAGRQAGEALYRGPALAQLRLAEAQRDLDGIVTPARPPR